MDTCVNCGLRFEGNNKKVKLTAKLTGTDLSVGEVLREVMSKANPVATMSPLKERRREVRGMCIKCCGKLKTLHFAWKHFFPAAGTDSYVRRKMDFKPQDKMEDTNATIVTPAPAPTPKPIPPKRALSLDNIRMAQIMPLRKELRRLAKSALVQGCISKPEDILDWTKFDNEMKLVAPKFHRLLYKLVGLKGNPINPKIGTAVLILLFSMNKFANRFQSGISFLLARTQTSKQVYALLNGMGICTSYTTLMKTMDTISPTCDPEVNDMGEDIWSQIENFYADQLFSTTGRKPQTNKKIRNRDSSNRKLDIEEENIEVLDIGEENAEVLDIGEENAEVVDIGEENAEVAMDSS